MVKTLLSKGENNVLLNTLGIICIKEVFRYIHWLVLVWTRLKTSISVNVFLRENIFCLHTFTLLFPRTFLTSEVMFLTHHRMYSLCSNLWRKEFIVRRLVLRHGNNVRSKLRSTKLAMKGTYLNFWPCFWRSDISMKWFWNTTT